jgi:DNA-binding MarR family transcriptional regulator
MLRAGSNRNGARKLFRPCYEPAKPFAHKKGQYLAFIYYYGKLNGQPHAEADMQRKFGVSPPSVHQMILTLETKGFIERIPGKGRSIRLLLAPANLPKLDDIGSCSAQMEQPLQLHSDGGAHSSHVSG